MIIQILSALYDRLLDPRCRGGVAAGVLVMYATGLLVAARPVRRGSGRAR
ncbi:hypothetical protein ACVGVM_12425 [Pseudonocardia bannensis]|uniref:Uncharacterized protein n=1 Tax=Pseudonocardia bannensis TaxID=630973 RepID=A0A848DEN1_9PSEU|nr:hypothetical protein [Pseudonocardia bannensis]NMH91080.1 hypothetical protein [Pseudonocardia bannensis]